MTLTSSKSVVAALTLPCSTYSFRHIVSFLFVLFYLQEWKDERISWNVSNYNGLEVVRLPAKNLWLPDIVLYNK